MAKVLRRRVECWAVEAKAKDAVQFKIVRKQSVLAIGKRSCKTCKTILSNIFACYWNWYRDWIKSWLIIEKNKHYRTKTQLNKSLFSSIHYHPLIDFLFSCTTQSASGTAFLRSHQCTWRMNVDWSQTGMQHKQKHILSSNIFCNSSSAFWNFMRKPTTTAAPSAPHQPQQPHQAHRTNHNSRTKRTVPTTQQPHHAYRTNHNSRTKRTVPCTVPMLMRTWQSSVPTRQMVCIRLCYTYLQPR